MQSWAERPRKLTLLDGSYHLLRVVAVSVVLHLNR